MEFIKNLYEEYSGVNVIKYEKFLERKINSFETNIPLVITEIIESEELHKKLNDIFGKREYTFENNTCIVLPIVVTERKQFTFGDLTEIIWRLKDKDGCPWDRAQTLKSIRNNCIEEAYELVEAVDLDDNAKICEEAGDVLLQGIFNGIIAEDDERFSLNDVVSGICYKLISRHTHIFGEQKATNAEEALRCWEQAKAKEKNQKSTIDKLESVPKTFSALLNAQKIQKIIKKTGFDFPSIDGAVEKVYEEINEFLTAKTDVEREKEGGDILFSVVNLLRMSHIDSELSLNGTTNRFKTRFSYVVKKAEEMGKKVEELTLEEMEMYYQEYKKEFEKC